MKSRVLTLILGFIVSNFAVSGISDLELSMEFDIPEYVYFGQSGLFSVTVKNNGPDIGGLSSPSSFPILVKSSILTSNEEFGGAKIGFLQQPVSQDCLFLVSIGEPLPGELPIFRFDFNYQVIPAGASVTCFGRYIVNLNSGQETVTWSVVSSSDTDPVLTNNSIDMVFKIRPPTVPILSGWALLMFIVFVFFISVYRLHKVL